MVAAPTVGGTDAVRLLALIAVLQLKPLDEVHPRALELVLQLGTLTAVGVASAPVAFARTVFAAIEERPESGIDDHPGALDAPVETIV